MTKLTIQLDARKSTPIGMVPYDSGLLSHVVNSTISRLKTKAARMNRLNLSKGECRKVARMLGESPNAWKQVEFFRSRRNFSSFPLGQQTSDMYRN